MNLNRVLETPMGNGGTIRTYLRDLLLTLWREGEGFNGKRPFGNSGWQWDIYESLIQCGAIKGTLDKYGYVESLDITEADELVLELIEGLCEAPE